MGRVLAVFIWSDLAHLGLDVRERQVVVPGPHLRARGRPTTGSFC